MCLVAPAATDWSAKSRLIFMEPQTGVGVFHMNRIDDALNINIRRFVDDIGTAVDSWHSNVVGTEPFETNAAQLMRRYPNGLQPYITGVSVIG
jgi:hypothetical protein